MIRSVGPNSVHFSDLQPDCDRLSLLRRSLFGFLLPLCLSSFSPLSAQNQSAPATPAAGQNTTQTPLSTAPTGAPTTLSVNVKVVSLPVTVRDKKGAIVRNLTKDDFELQEDGRPQSIRYFNQETNLPLTLGLLVDTSMSQSKVLDEERTASRSFLDQMVTNKDRAFVVRFDREVELLQDLTPEHSKLEAAVDLLQPSQYGQQTSTNDSQDGGGSGSSQRRMRGGGTLLYDSIFLASDELMKKQTGRKAIIVLSDGVDRGSKESLASALEAAQRADTIVYSIYFAGQEQNNNNFPRQGRGGYGGYPGGGYPGGGYPGRYPGGGYPGGGQQPSQNVHVDGKKILEQISGQTGGRLYEVSKKQSVDQIYADIAEELRTQYMLGYTPEKSDVEGFHRISLTTKKTDLSVQTRSGYYADQ
jgi:VWFA-related protein